MDPIKLHLTGTSIEELKRRVAAEHGPDARIVSAELVTVGGIGGFLARRHYELTVELPGNTDAEQPRPLRTDAGIFALLKDADAAESQFHAEARQPPVSTGSELFASLVEDLKATTGLTAPAGRQVPVRVPAPALKTGDLTVVVGLGDDALKVARSMARFSGASDHDDAAIRTAGQLHAPGVGSVNSRMEAMALRAAGVEGGHPVFVAYGIGPGVFLRPWAPRLQDLGADQVWVAVDARLKHEDTVRWLAHVEESGAAVYGLAVEGTAGTASPGSVNGLGLPIGWVDGQPSASASL